MVQDREELKSKVYDRKLKKENRMNSMSSLPSLSSSAYDSSHSTSDFSLVYKPAQKMEPLLETKDLPENLKEEQKKILEENAKRTREREMR
jgi:hypothetical protein